jgi:hypothetical protein
VSGIEQVTATVPVGAGASARAEAACPAGKSAVVGGYTSPAGSAWAVSTSLPSATLTSWVVEARNTGADTQPLTVAAVCALLAP